MILRILAQASQALQAAGFLVERCFPARGIPALQGPLAVLSLHKSNGTETVLAVSIYCEPGAGGSACEEAALAAAGVMEGLGAQCSMGACRCDRSQNLLVAEVFAAWTVEPAVTVLENGVALPGVTAIQAQYRANLNPIEEMGEGMVGMRWESSSWDITLEQLLPAEGTLPADSVSSFTLQICRETGIERYPNCRWVEISRKDTPRGLCQIRLARTWDGREVTNEAADL